MRDILLPIMAALASTLATTALADDSPGTDKGGQMFIEFGASTAPWAGNRLCDDLRFMNAAGRADSRMSSLLDPEALFQDADDCRAAFIAEHIIPRIVFGDVSFASDPQYIEADDSPFRYIGDCSDPRLEGPGIGDETVILVEENAPFPLACRIPFLSGAVILKAETKNSLFLDGYDGGEFAYDEECDDPRFEGEGMASSTIRLNVGRDASDCASSSVKRTETVLQDSQNSIDFGNNASRYSYDGECDDPRFEGEEGEGGMASTLVSADKKKDAIDCFRAYKAGRIVLSEQE